MRTLLNHKVYTSPLAVFHDHHNTPPHAHTYTHTHRHTHTHTHTHRHTHTHTHTQTHTHRHTPHTTQNTSPIVQNQQNIPPWLSQVLWLKQTCQLFYDATHHQIHGHTLQIIVTLQWGTKLTRMPTITAVPRRPCCDYHANYYSCTRETIVWLPCQLLQLYPGDYSVITMLQWTHGFGVTSLYKAGSWVQNLFAWIIHPFVYGQLSQWFKFYFESLKAVKWYQCSMLQSETLIPTVGQHLGGKQSW